MGGAFFPRIEPTLGSNMTVLPQTSTRARLEAEIDRSERAIKSKEIEAGYLKSKSTTSKWSAKSCAKNLTSLRT
jgi:hypothetical protein